MYVGFVHFDAAAAAAAITITRAPAGPWPGGFRRSIQRLSWPDLKTTLGASLLSFLCLERALRDRRP